MLPSLRGARPLSRPIADYALPTPERSGPWAIRVPASGFTELARAARGIRPQHASLLGVQFRRQCMLMSRQWPAGPLGGGPLFDTQTTSPRDKPYSVRECPARTMNDFVPREVAILNQHRGLSPISQVNRASQSRPARSGSAYAGAGGRQAVDATTVNAAKTTRRSRNKHDASSILTIRRKTTAALCTEKRFVQLHLRPPRRATAGPTGSSRYDDRRTRRADARTGVAASARSMARPPQWMTERRLSAGERSDARPSCEVRGSVRRVVSMPQDTSAGPPAFGVGQLRTEERHRIAAVRRVEASSASLV